jgi:serine/threonine-protein kinase RsbW
MAEIPYVCLTLRNRPENVLVVRQALGGVADSLGLDAVATNDLNTAVTEACNNVVLHAYGGDDGPLEVDLYALADGIAVVVRDRGDGIAPIPDIEGAAHASGSGIGLPVIHALSRHVQITDRRGGGTEVRMEFDAPNAAALEPLDQRARDNGVADARVPMRSVESNMSVELRLAPTMLARAVLPRVLSALAARAYFSIDRIADVQLVADVLAANARDSISGTHLEVGVTTAPRNLELRLGPLHTGKGESLISAAADGLAPVIERLTDEQYAVTSTDAAAETLELRLVERQH